MNDEWQWWTYWWMILMMMTMMWMMWMMMMMTMIDEFSDWWWWWWWGQWSHDGWFAWCLAQTAVGDCQDVFLKRNNRSLDFGLLVLLNQCQPNRCQPLSINVNPIIVHHCHCQLGSGVPHRKTERTLGHMLWQAASLVLINCAPSMSLLLWSFLIVT